MSVHVSAKHKVVGVPVSLQLQGLFPQARIVDFNGLNSILLPHGITETKMLRNLGYDVPAPILTQYQWTGNNKPFNVQRFTAAMLSSEQRCYCLNGMGTGKTKSALWAYDYLRGIGAAKKVLVVAPLSTLDNVWRAEVLKTTPHLSCGVLHGTKQKRLKVLAEQHDVYVINTDGLRVIEKELKERKDINVMIIDELAVFRNATSERNKCCRKIAENMVWLWGLTGSPTPDEPTDAFGQCKIVTPHTVPKYFTRFREELMVKISPFKWAAKRDATEKVFQVMQPAVRYTLDDVVELPPMIERTVDIAMSKKQRDVYEALRMNAHAAVQSHSITAVNAGTVFGKLLQVSMGVVYSDTRGIVDLGNGARLDQLVTDVQACAEKVIVFVPYTHGLMSVFHRLTSEGIECAVVDGNVPKRARDYIFTAFQNSSKFKVIVAHPGTMAHGLTLTAATCIIWYGPTTSLETFEQAYHRIRRIGQSKKQLMLMYQSSPIEKKTYSRLRSKQKVQFDILSMFAEASQ